MKNAFDIASKFVVMSDRFEADVMPLTNTLYAELEDRYGGFVGHALIASHSFDGDWPTWEVHPKGDEFVMLLSGEADMVFAAEAGDETIRLSRFGQYVIVPRGVWHTARVPVSASMLFITPGEGTENREQPERGG